MILAVALGGATRSNAVGDTILQLLAVPLLIWAIWRRHDMPAGMAWPAGFIAAAVLLVLAQLVPVPPAIWTALPLRQLSVEALQAVGQELGWRPISMAPQLTVLSLLALLPPLAVFLGMAQQSYHERRRLFVVLLLSGVVSCAVGLGQVAGLISASASVAPTDASGFFVNRNHLASYLAVLIVLASVFALDGIKTLTVEPERIREPVLLTTIGAATLAILIFLGTIILTRSRAGIGLAMIAVVAAVVLARADSRRSSGRTAFGLAIIGIVAILLPASQFALYRVMERFGEDPLSDGRAEIAPVVWSAIQKLLPFGSGLGTFVPVFKEVEEPARALMGVYVNRAHNDYLESVMELGIPAVVLMGIFAVWLVRRFRETWRQQDTGAPIDTMLARAASIIILILLAHSFADYPLRTATLGCLFAAACASQIPPRPRHGTHHHSERDDAVSHQETRLPAQTAASPQPATQSAVPSLPEPVGVARRSENSSTSSTFSLDRGRWPDAWQPAGAPPDDKTTDADALSEPVARAVPSDAPKRDLKEVLQDQNAWPKEWLPKRKPETEG